MRNRIAEWLLLGHGPDHVSDRNKFAFKKFYGDLFALLFPVDQKFLSVLKSNGANLTVNDDLFLLMKMINENENS